MSKRDYYDVLGVGRDADAAALKSAFRKLALKHHPDRNPGDAAAEASFKEANEAYSILSDKDQRAAYDRFGHAAFEHGMGGGGMGGRGGAPFGHPAEDFVQDIFSDLFGAGRRRRAGPQRGPDLRYNMTLSLEEAFSGTKTVITVPGREPCKTCDGTGAKPGTKISQCDTCGGSGRVGVSQGFFHMERTCPDCGGRGVLIEERCADCGGTGEIEEERKLEVDVPAGVESGMRIRLRGEGAPGEPGAPRGDLYIFVSVEPHELFERDGVDLYCPAHVPMARAALGGEIEIPTISGGRARVSIPEGAQTGHKLRLRGKGMPSLKDGRNGDLYVEVYVETPSNLTERQKEMLREFDDCANGDCHPESQGFLGKVKSFFDGRGEGAKPH